MIRSAIAAVVIATAACSGSPGGPNMNSRIGGAEVTPQSSPVVSADILAREAVTNSAQVTHILIGWKELDSAHDPRAAKRTKQDAEAVVKDLLAKIAAGGDFNALMKEHSEDPGSAANPQGYTVTPDAHWVIEFKQLGLRLHVNEVGVVQSDFGFHIIKRIQ
jgi:foldase protein PrsA